MFLLTFSYGLLLGFGLILPLGPQNLFVLSQGLRAKKKHILATVIVAATCDTVLILAAILGITLLLFQWEWIKAALMIGGILIMCYLGWQSWNAPLIDQNAANDTPNGKLVKIIAATALVSLVNPYAVIDTVFTIGSVSMTYSGINRSIFASGCIIASWLWFSLLAISGRTLYQFNWIRKSNGKMSGGIIWLAMLYLTYKLIHSFIH